MIADMISIVMESEEDQIVSQSDRKLELDTERWKVRLGSRMYINVG